MSYEYRLTVNGVVTLLHGQTWATVADVHEEIADMGDPAGYAEYIRESDRYGSMLEFLAALGCPDVAAPYVWGFVVAVAE